jgi:branched-chain amino acid transport system substrate-binding protein
MLSPFQRRLPGLLLAALAILWFTARVAAQAPPEPYAAINRDAVNYAGPGRETAHDLAGTEVRIGLLVPLQGPRQAEGEALLQAAQLAIEDAAANPLPAGRRLALATRDESGPWGRASSEIVRLVFDDHAVALITSTEGGAAHLAEQIGNKIGVPVLTLSSDKTTTQINLPWIFRLGPTDAAQARAFTQNIYRERGLKSVVLVTENDHDGRVGGEEFLKAARDFTARDSGAEDTSGFAPRESNAPAPVRMVIGSVLADLDAIVKGITRQKPEALVLWTGHEAAATLVARVRDETPSVPIYLCRKAAQESFEDFTGGHCRPCSSDRVAAGVAPTSRPADGVAATLRPAGSSASPRSNADDGGIWVVASPARGTADRESFERRYRQRTGSTPSLAAAQAYDAVRIVAAALRYSGPNRARLRDSLAELSGFPGVSGMISFDHAGNDTTPVALVRTH